MRSFDLILHDETHVRLSDAGMDLGRITFVDVKATRKPLKNPPSGFFFGATENEFSLASTLGDRFKFCFTCLNDTGLGFTLLTLGELLERVQNKRTQYQISLR